MKKFRSQHFLITQSTHASEGELALQPKAQLQFAVPKKLLKRAVDRNAVRRVGKESWRSIVLGAGDSNKPSLGGCQVRIRLLSRPKDFADLSRPARKRFWRSELDRLITKMTR